MRARSVVVVALALAAGCGGARPEGAEEPAPPPQPVVPRGAAVPLLDLLPAEASGAALVEVGRMRPSRTGRSLIELVRRVGASDWEEAVGVDLANDVERLLLFVTPAEDGEPGDLSELLATARASTLGIVLELSEPPAGQEATCFEGPLSTAVPYALEGAASAMDARSCGPLVILRARGTAVAPEPGSPAAAAIAAAAADVEAEALVLTIVAGPAMVDRATCDDRTLPLAGFQAATVELGDGVVLRGRYHAGSGEDAPALRSCVTDGLGGFAGVPLLSQLELDGLLSEGDVTLDPERPADVTLQAGFTDGELSLMMGVLELLGEGVQSDAATQ